MDFLDPKKQKAHSIRLIIGYILIGFMLLLATVILVYQAYGFGIDRHGRIIRNGLVFVSSVPSDADIYVNGERKARTADTLVLPAGPYVFEIKREGYRTWKRAVTVEGGTVQRFDYPLLFAETLETKTAKQYAAPGLATQSPDLRWLLVQSNTPDVFDLFDMNSSTPTPTAFTIPLEILSVDTTTIGWQEVEWSKNNRHVVLRRLFTKSGQESSEYILVDRENASASRNLSVLLGFTPTVLELRDKAYDQYFVFDQPNGTLFTASLEQPTPRPYLSNVLAFTSDGTETVLYVTDQEAPPGKALIRIRQGEDSYTIRQVASDAAPYMLDLARYSGAWYVAAGASGEDKIYVYKNPVDTLRSSNSDVLVPVHILKTVHPTYVMFAPGARFVLAENGQDFAVYDIKNNKGYAYEIGLPIDSALGHAVWIDGYHLATTSGGQTLVFDYDGTNNQILSPTSQSSLPYFGREYRQLYTITPDNRLTVTELRTPNNR